MSKFLKGAVALTLLSTPVFAESFGLGREALPEEIAAWDIDVRPDGTGLPAGSGDVLTGEEVFADKCASCHGDFAEGVGNWPKLAGGWDTLADEDPLKTVGSYWPYLSTTWDYVNRSMPFGDAQSLEADEVYAIVAYILYSNDLVEDDFVLSDETFADFEMPNRDGFIVDDRIETEHAQWVGEPCMENCKEDVQVTMRAMVLDVTPEAETAAPEEEAAVAPAAAPAVEVAAVDPELIAAGEKVFRKCKACHQIGAGAKNRSGPVLTGIVGQAAGQVEGFKYSKPLMAMAEDGLVWDAENLQAFLSKPKAFMKGTKMSFAGLKKEADLAAITAYLASVPE
ncbi:c-type cytochrome [uncultured Roseobacter sp.]|uniref:c-type cytochrome n=1 Tax=uncultured Roseobacter sp. TaxID=114847 RepID=UPI00260B2E8C|nr:c-type cytochrome [uncultured Roseobacter sp.]